MSAGGITPHNPGADRAQQLVPVRSREHPWGHVVARDPHAGRLVACPCGARRWTAYGHAGRHGRACPAALVELAAQAERRGRHGVASNYRHLALAQALRRAGRQGYTARELATILGYTAGHVRVLLAGLERVGVAERRSKLPARWRRRRG